MVRGARSHDPLFLASCAWIRLLLCVALLSTSLAAGVARSQSAAITDAYSKARTLATEGKTEEALPHAQKALELARQELGENHKVTGILAFNLGVIYLDLGQSAEAKLVLLEARSIYQAVYGEEAPELLEIERDLGRVHYDLGELDEARDSYGRALAIVEKQSGEESLEVAEVLIPLSIVESERKRYRRVRSYGRRVVRIYKKQLGENDQKVGWAYLGLSKNEFQDGDVAEGERYLKKGLKILEAELSVGNQKLLVIHGAVAQLYDSVGMKGRAKDYRDKVTEGKRAARRKREKTGDGG